jgi:Uma2 family endonuclease
MITAKENFPHFTPLEYLGWEEQQEFRHEFVDGKVHTMTAKTVDCDRIAANFSTILQNHLQSTVCRVLDADIKVQIMESNSFLYPDVSVTCDVHDRSANNFITHPCLIVAVLSPSTETDDRGDKFALYRCLTSLQEYVLVSTNAIRLDVHQRNEQGDWDLSSYEAGDVVELKSVDLRLEIDRVYEDIVF